MHAAGHVIGDDGEWHAHVWNLDRYAHQGGPSGPPQLDAVDNQSMELNTRTESRSLTTIPLSKSTGEAAASSRLVFLFMERLPGGKLPRITVFDGKGSVVWAHEYMVPHNYQYDAHKIIYSPKESRLILVGSVGATPMIMSIDAKEGKSAKFTQFNLTTGQEGDFTGILEVGDGFVVTGWIKGFKRNDRDLLLVKYSANFSVVWRRVCGGSKDDEGWAVAKDFDSSIIVGGRTGFKTLFNKVDAWVVKLDQTGYVMGEAKLEEGKVIGFANIRFSNADPQSFAILDNGSVYGLKMQSVPSLERTWGGVNTWTAKPFASSSSPLAEPNLTCIDPDVTMQEGPDLLVDGGSALTKMMRDKRPRP